MHTRKFLERLQNDEIVAAIRKAEKKTSGEIRVFISHKPVEAPVTTAQAHFSRMSMTKTRDHNGVLIFVAPSSQKFAVIGDRAVHEKCGEEFWQRLTGEMTRQFKDGHFNRGILLAIEKAGDLLAQHFPRRPDDQNELPDEVEQD